MYQGAILVIPSEIQVGQAGRLVEGPTTVRSVFVPCQAGTISMKSTPAESGEILTYCMPYLVTAMTLSAHTVDPSSTLTELHAQEECDWLDNPLEPWLFFWLASRRSGPLSQSPRHDAHPSIRTL